MLNAALIKRAIWIAFVSTLVAAFLTKPPGRPPGPEALGRLPELNTLRGEIAGHPAPGSTETGAEAMLRTEVATGTVVNTLTTSDLSSKEQILTVIYHAEAQQKAFIEHAADHEKKLEDRLAKSQATVEALTARLASAEKAADQSAQRVTALEAKLGTREAREKQDIKKLVKLLALIPSPKLVAMFQEMDDDLVSLILVQMKDTDVAKILAGLPSKRAVGLSLQMSDLKKARS